MATCRPQWSCWISISTGLRTDCGQGDPKCGGGLDPQKTRSHVVRPEWDNLRKAYSKAGPPPYKVKPIPIQLLCHAYNTLKRYQNQAALTIADLMVLGFFWLLCPGEYTYSKQNNHPFRFCDVTFVTPHGPFNAVTISDWDLRQAHKGLLRFTT